jgi:hypothetical protein
LGGLTGEGGGRGKTQEVPGGPEGNPGGAQGTPGVPGGPQQAPGEPGKPQESPEEPRGALWDANCTTDSYRAARIFVDSVGLGGALLDANCTTELIPHRTDFCWFKGGQPGQPSPESFTDAKYTKR